MVLYEYRPTRKAEHAEHFLQGFSGWLHADGYQGYHKLQGTYTATLSQGTHTLRVVYTNGAAVTTTFVLKGTTSPHTGDPGVGIYLASVVLSIAGSAYVFRKKKNDD